MKLIDYIKDIGVEKFSNLYGVTESQAYRLMKFENAPEAKLAFRVVKGTHGLVSWAEVYQPFFDQKEAAGTQLEFET